MKDPFEPFERSQAGLLIPVVLFLVGAIATAWMINTVISVDERIVEQDRAAGQRVEGFQEELDAWEKEMRDNQGSLPSADVPIAPAAEASVEAKDPISSESEERATP